MTWMRMATATSCSFTAVKVLLIFVGFCIAYDFDSLHLSSQRYNLCGRYACSTDGKYAFSSATKYTYHYSLEINSTLDKNINSSSDVKLEFKVEVRIRSCEGTLRVKRAHKNDFSIFDEETDSDRLVNELSQYTLKFSFYDGTMHDICPHKDETILSLNMKKGILSAFQNKMRRFDVDTLVQERDVNGFCPTYYNLEKVNGTTLVIKKVKSIPGCVERYQLHSIIPTSRFIFQGRYHKWSPLNSSVVCHQTIDHGVPIHVICKEEHQLKILENQEQSSSTSVVQELELISESTVFDTFITSLYYPDEIEIRENLAFNHKKPKKSEISELEESRSLLLQLCNVTSDEFQLEAATVFSRFIHTARHLSYDALRTLYDDSPLTCSTGRRQIQDSLPYLRSTSAISLMKDILIEGGISSSTANGWLFAMAMFSRPDFDVVNSVTELLFENGVSNMALLSISSVLHSYCVWAATDCSQEEIVVTSVKKIEALLNTSLQENDITKGIVALKSLGNAGVVTDTIGYTLSQCVLNGNTTVLKIAAIQAYRRLPCDYEIDFLLDVYTSIEYETEVRISAYLQIMRCPAYKTIKKIKYMLQNEAVNQVGSFVWSHLKNTMKSAMLTAVEIQSILQDYDLKNKYNLDFRKFSKNYETSFYLTDYGVGTFVTSNVVFSPKSYLPRFVNANFSIGLFGETINAFEVQAYSEGFESYFETGFRYGANFAAYLMDATRLSSLKFLRNIPSIRNKISELSNDTHRNVAEPYMSLAIKIFGNELFYWNFKGVNEVKEAIVNISPYKIIAEFFSGQEIKFDQSAVFMDISYVAPTGAGVPLNLDAVGIGITNFDMAVLVDMDNFLKLGDLLISGKLKPRFSVNLEGIMGTELVYKQSQVKLKSNVFTSSALEGSLEVNRYNNVSLSFNVPLHKFDIFNVETNLMCRNEATKQDVVIPAEVFGPVSAEEVCFWPLVEQALGLKICSSYSLSNVEQIIKSPTYLLRWPFKFSVFIEKSDPTAKVYVFLYHRSVLQRNSSVTHFSFETPNSNIERSMRAVVYTSDTGYNTTIMIHANRTVVEAQGLYYNVPNDKLIDFHMDINGERHIDLILGLQTKHEKRALIYSPKVYFAVSSKAVVELTGTYRWVTKKGISQCDIDLHFKTNRFNSTIMGYIRVDERSVSTNIHVRYKFEKGNFESLKFEAKYGDRSTKMSSVKHTSFQLESTAYPEINFLVTLKYEKSQDHVNLKVDYVSLPYIEDDTQKLFAQFAFIYFKSFSGLKLNTHLEIRRQVSDLDVKLAFTHQDNPAGSTSVFLIRYATDRDIIMRLDIAFPQSIYFQYEVKLNVSLPSVEQPMIIYAKIFERLEKEYDLDFSGTWFSGHTAMAKGIFQDRSTHYSSNYNLKLQLRSRLIPEILFNGKLVYDESEYQLQSTVDYDNVRYIVVIRHLVDNSEQYDTFAEFSYNQSAVYFVNNHISFPKKEIITELHLDKYRDIYVALRGMLGRWTTNFGVEVKWDVNRDPSQKLIFNVRTYSEVVPSGIKYIGRSLFEYPGHISVFLFVVQRKESRYSTTLTLEMNPTSKIEAMAFLENDVTTKGIGQIGFKLLTPFENWRETSLNSGVFVEKQSFRTNGSLVWQGNQTMVFDTYAGYIFDEHITNFILSSSLNSSLPDLTALAFKVGYRSVANEVYLDFLLQPNVKYLISVHTFGKVKRFEDGVQYYAELYTKTPFLEYSKTETNIRLKLMTEHRIDGDFSLMLNDDFYNLSAAGILRFLDESYLCLKISTPYEQYNRVRGRIIFTPEERHLYINFKGNDMELGTDVSYVYNNLSNFDLKFQIISPLHYLNKFLIAGIYNGKELGLIFGLNSFLLGFNTVSYFETWSNFHYALKVFTPLQAFKETSAVIKVLVSEELILKAHLTLSNSKKIGAIIEYNSERSKAIRGEQCVDEFSSLEPPINGVILYNVLLTLDTLSYPTMMAMFKSIQTEGGYMLELKLSVLHLQMLLLDKIDYTNIMLFYNTLELQTSVDVFSHVICHTRVNGSSEGMADGDIDIEVTSFSRTFRGGMDVRLKYEYIFPNKSAKTLKPHTDIVYNLEAHLYTPFEMLETCNFGIVLYSRDRQYDVSLNVYTDYTNARISGNVEVDQNFFDVDCAVNITSTHLVVPPMNVKILKDFNKLEKEILFLFKAADDAEGLLDVFYVRSSWYIDSRNFITLSGEVKTPFKILDELKGTLHYSHEYDSNSYHLECYMKYSNKTELKARAKLTPPSVTVNLESTMEGLRSAHFVGTLQQVRDGDQVIDAVMISDSNFRIQGWSSASENVPFALEGKLIRGKDKSIVSSVNMHVKKVSGGYHVLAMLHSSGKTLDVETGITSGPNNTKSVNVRIMTSKVGIESLQVNGQFLLQHPGVYIFIVRGSSMVGDAKGSLTSEVKIWFRNSIGAAFATLDSSILKGKAEFFSVWNPPNSLYAGAKGSYTVKEKNTDFLLSKVYFIKSVNSFVNLTTGISVDLAQKWSLHANMTALLPGTNDMAFVSYVQFPNKNIRWCAGRLNYDEKFDTIQHLLMYSQTESIVDDKPCYSISDYKWMGDEVKGMLAVRCGVSNPVFMLDNLHGRKQSNRLLLTNILKSNTVSSNLLTKAVCEKLGPYYNIMLELFYPPEVQITDINISIKSMSNFKCHVNTTTPFITMPAIACDIVADTSTYLYHRYGKVNIHEKSAFINITHTKKKKSDVMLNDGNIRLMFPIATVHDTLVTYIYEDANGNIKGSSNITYNGEKLIDSNFTRNVTTTPIVNSNFVHVTLGNLHTPLGVNYLHQCNNPVVPTPIFDLKRIELFKIKNASSFNFTGALWSKTDGDEEWSSVKVLNFNRSLIFKSHKHGSGLSESGASLNLKPELWIGYWLKMSKKSTALIKNKVIDLNIAYPRRNFSLIGDASYGDGFLESCFTVRSFLAKPTKSVGVIFYTRKLTFNHRQAYLTLFHPSFAKNVTLTTGFVYSEPVLIDVKLGLEYSPDKNRKLSLTGAVEDHSPRNGRNYSLTLSGRHPASKLKLDVAALFVSEIGVHLLTNNVSYKRSYLPNHYWNGRGYINTKVNVIEIERSSLSGMVAVHGDYKTRDTQHIVNAFWIKNSDVNVCSVFLADLYNKQTYLSVNLTGDASDRLQMEGNIPENREMKFNIWRTYNDLIYPQVSSYLRLNHSRFVSSAVLWRNDITTNVLLSVRTGISYLWTSTQDAAEFWTQFLRSEASDAITDIWYDMKPVLHEFLDDLNDVKTIQDNINYFRSVLNESYHKNEFFLHDMHELYLLLTEDISFVNKFGSLPKIVSEVWESMGETGKVIKRSVVWFIDSLRQIYEDLLKLLDNLVEGGTEAIIANFVQRMTEKFDIFIKELHIVFISSAERALNELITVLSDYWKKTMLVFEPTFIEIVHYIDSTFWASTRKLMAFIYARREELLSSPYFLRSANFTHQLDTIYKDLAKNDVITNAKKYFTIVFNAMYEYYLSQIPFRQELNAISSEIIGEVKELYKLPLIAYTVDNIRLMYDQAIWLYEYLDISSSTQSLMSYLYKRLFENSFSALESELRSHKPKTKFIFEPENGVIKFEQKLPFPWHAFNETPIYEELPEYKTLKKYQSYFHIPTDMFWKYYYYAMTALNPSAWFPPFKGQAYVIGFKNFITFDGKVIEFDSRKCLYLLSQDFVDKSFSIFLDYEENAVNGYKGVSFVVDGETVTVDMEKRTIRINSKPSFLLFPLQMNMTTVYFDNGIATVVNNRGIRLECNINYQICTVHLTGWFFGKVSGLLGTMNNEAIDDNPFSSTTKYFGEEKRPLAERDSLCAIKNKENPIVSVSSVNELCHELFMNKTSALESCFKEVDPLPFYNACKTAVTSEETCTFAMSYVYACSNANSPIRVPDVCVKCSLYNGTSIEEGKFISIEHEDGPESADIVYIVEAKSCNRNVFTNRNMNILFSSIITELDNNGIVDNRFALVTFGGDGVYNDIHSVAADEMQFTNFTLFPRYFKNIIPGDGNSDIFSAVRFATKLRFRPGVAKAFILMPCSSCDPSNMTLDYSTLHHAMSEKTITLHVLMDADFPTDKVKSGKIPFGVDSVTAYTRSDTKILKGDSELRNELKITKSLLGYCVPLALESNGSLFSAKRLEDDNINFVRKFATVFSKRLVSSMKSDTCQNCECHSDVNGIPYADCVSCLYPAPINFDFGLEEEEKENTQVNADTPMMDMDTQLTHE